MTAGRGLLFIGYGRFGIKYGPVRAPDAEAARAMIMRGMAAAYPPHVPRETARRYAERDAEGMRIMRPSVGISPDGCA